MDFELLLGGQVGYVKCEQVQNAISQNRLKPVQVRAFNPAAPFNPPSRIIPGLYYWTVF